MIVRMIALYCFAAIIWNSVFAYSMEQNENVNNGQDTYYQELLDEVFNKNKSSIEYDSFSYDNELNNGPGQWSRLNWKCGGKNQSPINIITKDSIKRNSKSPVQIAFPDRAPLQVINLVNNGNSLSLSILTTSPPILNWGGLTNAYVLAEVHFHFGCKSDRGSEHQINGKSYPIEVHFVFWNRDKHKNFNAAKNDEAKKGLAVVAVFLNVQNQYDVAEPIYSLPFQTIQKFIRQNALGVNAKAKVPFNLKHFFQYLLPKDITLGSKKFYSYDGSLTTPECNESVKWIVMADTLPITEKSLQAIRQLPSNTNHPRGIYKGKMCDNFRPIQNPKRLVFS